MVSDIGSTCYGPKLYSSNNFKGDRKMFIQYEKGLFINAAVIDWIQIKESAMIFAISSDPSSEFIVAKDFQSSFINNLQAISGGAIEAAYHAIEPVK